MWGIAVPIIGAVTPMHPAPAIVITPPGGEPPNRVEAEKHISYALTASSVAAVQDRACTLELVEYCPETLARDVLPTRRDGSVWTQSDYGLTPYWAAHVKKQFGKNPDVHSINRVPGMAQATRWVSSLEDFFSNPADPSKLYWMCPPYHRFAECVRKIQQEELRAIVVGPKLIHREWWKPLMKITLQGYHLPGPETNARLYQNDHLTPLPKRGGSKVALYVDGDIAEENLAATKSHVASVLAAAVVNPNTDEEPGMTSEESRRMKGCLTIWLRCPPSHIKRPIKNSSLPLLLTLPPKIWRRKNACVHALRKLGKGYSVGGPLPLSATEKLMAPNDYWRLLVSVALSPPKHLLCLLRWSS